MFKKVFGVLGIVMCLAVTGCGSENAEEEENVSPEVEVTGEVEPRERGTESHQVCARNCHDTCSIITEVKDGKIINIRGDATNPITAGGLCVKMNHYESWVYHPDRILYPMKRVGAKGEGKFEQITWDEAIETIVTKTKENIEKYGPETVMPYSYSGNLGFIQWLLTLRSYTEKDIV